jgi:chromosome segregation ATPase
MQVSGDALGEATGDIVSHFSLNKLFPSLNALQATLAFTNMQRDLMEETQVNAFTNSSDWNKEISQNSDFSGTTVTVTGSQDVQDQVNQDRDAKTEELRSLMLQATGTLAEAKQELQQLTNNQATIRDDLKSINQKIDNLEEKIKNAKGDKKEELKEKLNDLNKTQQELKSSQTTVRQNLQNAEAEKKEAKTALNQAANNFNTYVSTVAVVPEIKSSNSNKKKK